MNLKIPDTKITNDFILDNHTNEIIRQSIYQLTNVCEIRK